MAARKTAMGFAGLGLVVLGVVGAGLGIGFGSTKGEQWGPVAAGAVLVAAGVCLYYLATSETVHRARLLTVGLLLIGIGCLLIAISTAWTETAKQWIPLGIGLALVLGGAFLTGYVQALHSHSRVRIRKRKASAH